MKKLKIQIIKMIEDIVRRMTEGEINPLQLARAINERLNTVNFVKYSTGPKTSVKFKGNSGEGNIRVCGDRKTRERIIEVAALAYVLAQANGYLKPGEVHISPRISSKHHQNEPGGFRDYTAGLMAKYSQN